MYKIDYGSYRPRQNFNRRTRFLVLHYTALDFDASIKALTGPNVSVHYLIPDPTDATYRDAGFEDMRIFNLVAESERAWHAGVSYWGGRTNLNDTSIGIEIVNQATERNGVWTFPPYHAEQIAALRQLARNILRRYPDIVATNVVGHSDIAPSRKSDPGAAFPWQALHHAGIGAWYGEPDKQKYLKQLTALPDRSAMLEKFKRYGYDTCAAHSDSGFRDLVRAFQLHFRPSCHDGELDIETAAILYALVDKYFPA